MFISDTVKTRCGKDISRTANNIRGYGTCRCCIVCPSVTGCQTCVVEFGDGLNGDDDLESLIATFLIIIIDVRGCTVVRFYFGNQSIDGVEYLTAFVAIPLSECVAIVKFCFCVVNSRSSRCIGSKQEIRTGISRRCCRIRKYFFFSNFKFNTATVGYRNVHSVQTKCVQSQRGSRAVLRIVVGERVYRGVRFRVTANDIRGERSVCRTSCPFGLVGKVRIGNRLDGNDNFE